MNSILEKIVAHKLVEIQNAKNRISLTDLKNDVRSQSPPRDFCEALRNHRRIGTGQPSLGLIAEVKKASPSKGVIREDFDPVSIARTYVENGADCLSVLTDENFFQGHLEYLKQIRAAVSVPLLRKEFVLDLYQVFEARAAGADAVLLIAECLQPSQMRELHSAITELGMTSLIELHDERNLDSVLACNPTLVGINNRDLNSFQVDLNHSIQLAKKIPANVMVVSESGIQSSHDVQRLANQGIHAMLVGESLIRAKDIGQAVQELLA